MLTTSTTLSSWTLLIWKALQAHGLDSHSIFKQAGLDPTSLSDGNARYRLEDMTRLWEISLQETGDPCFGVEVGKSWVPTTFHALGFAWLASHTLKDALMRLTRYARIVNNSISAKLEEKGAHLELYFSTSEDEKNIHYAARDAGTVAIISMCRSLCGEGFSPIEINVTRERSLCSDKLEAYLGIPVNYNSENNLTLFDRMRAEERLASGNSELVLVNEEVAMKYLNTLNRDSTVMLVNAAIIKMMPSGQVSEEEIADALNMSVRTLQRKLSEETTSFSTIYKAIRQEMADAYIQNSSLSMTEISYLLGFSEQANFTRAYKRWYGTSPSAARQSIQNSGFA